MTLVWTVSLSHLPIGARGTGPARISGEVESIFKELCRGLNARDISHVAQYAPPYELLFPRTLTRPLSSGKRSTNSRKDNIGPSSVSSECQVY
ncbi:hypothetical protein BGY98DRAFT_1041616 [Russula aff. rugulosa BPL654]|nr:hypothetical protein BGY98DRAFT_1041616 [Russula aff. rugulosa BPL654]